MHQLLLLRHAKSSRDDPRLEDRDRPLNDRGFRDAAALRKSMQTLGLAPDLVLVSPSRRTMQTLSALEPWDDTPLTESVESLYLADEAQLLGTLRDIPETVRSALLIAHNPGLRDLVHILSHGPNRDPPDSLPTCTLAEFMLTGPWRDLPSGTRLLRKLGPKHTLT